MSPPSLCAASCSTPPRAPPPRLRFRRPATSVSVSAARAAPAVSDDLVLRIAEQLEDSVIASSPLLDPLRSNEAFRFTDISYLRSLPISLPSQTPYLAPPSSPFKSHVLFSDGLLASASGAHVAALVADLPPGRARDRTAAALAASAEFAHKDLLYDFNTVGARDVAVVHVPEGVKIAKDPVHIMFTYSGSDGGSMMMSNPRVLGGGGHRGGALWGWRRGRWVLLGPRCWRSSWMRVRRWCIPMCSGSHLRQRIPSGPPSSRYAQQTDAGQQTKCLLLSPKALVNVKPNLQIIADDVKCTHGAAISGELIEMSSSTSER